MYFELSFYPSEATLDLVFFDHTLGLWNLIYFGSKNNTINTSLMSSVESIRLYVNFKRAQPAQDHFQLF